jgi:hypothetical protein
MKLIPKYSYEFNCILNEKYNDREQVENYASLLTDKDRFLPIVKYLEKNLDLIQNRLGYGLKEEIEFFVVRAEKFKSFSEPITIEYSILPEEMILFLIKEITKSSITDRFLDEISRENYLNAFCDHIAINGDFGSTDLVKYTKNLHEYSKILYPKYEYREIDFSKKTMKEHIESIYEESFK